MAVRAGAPELGAEPARPTVRAALGETGASAGRGPGLEGAATPTAAEDLTARSADHFDVQGTLLTFGLLVAAAAAQVLSPESPLTETLTARSDWLRC